MNPDAKKYPAASTPIKPPTSGKSHMLLALVNTKSSVSAKGIIVKKDSKSLKVFIAFDFDIYPITGPMRI